MTSEPIVLGVETSCDETGIGIVRGRELLANQIASSVDEHARFGGVVPEIASRAHLEAMAPTLERACSQAGLRLADIDAVAVTAGPGLVGALLVGTAAAQALAWSIDKPIYAVNHLAAHVAVDELENGPAPEPSIALLVSGGHTSLLRVGDVATDIEPLGATLDDAAGEAFDKVARLLDLPFPGGPHVDAAAASGDPNFVEFPRAMPDTLDFSFSGLKTAVARWVEGERAVGKPISVPDVAAAFQEAVVDVLTAKALRACRDQDVDHLMIGGGVAANSRLRALAEQRAAAAGVRLRIPRPGLCTDNGAMVAALGARMIDSGLPPSGLSFPARSSLPVAVTQLTGDDLS